MTTDAPKKGWTLLEFRGELPSSALAHLSILLLISVLIVIFISQRTYRPWWPEYTFSWSVSLLAGFILGFLLLSWAYPGLISLCRKQVWVSDANKHKILIILTVISASLVLSGDPVAELWLVPALVPDAISLLRAGTYSEEAVWVVQVGVEGVRFGLLVGLLLSLSILLASFTAFIALGSRGGFKIFTVKVRAIESGVIYRLSFLARPGEELRMVEQVLSSLPTRSVRPKWQEVLKLAPALLLPIATIFFSALLHTFLIQYALNTLS